jgi:serine/threonine protein kinase
VARFVFLEVIDTVAFIHNSGFAHRDLKEKNILVDGVLDVSNSAHWFKITDFGFTVATRTPSG